MGVSASSPVIISQSPTNLQQNPYAPIPVAICFRGSVQITPCDRTAINPLKGWVYGGAQVGPLKPTPAHSQMSIRNGMNIRLRGGIQIPAAR